MSEADPENSEQGARVPFPPPPPLKENFTVKAMQHTGLWVYLWCKVMLTFRKIELKSIL